MKRLFSSAVLASLLCVSVNALEIDEASVKTHFVGFKMAKKLGVPGVINDAVYKFGKNSGSAVEILEGTTASMDFTNENTKDKTRDKNIHRTFISKLINSKIEAKLHDVKGNDDSGEAIASITFNNVTKDIPVKYEVNNGKLVVKGEINMRTDFNTEDSFIALSTDKQVAALHGKKTHEEVEIYFDVDVK